MSEYCKNCLKLSEKIEAQLKAIVAVVEEQMEPRKAVFNDSTSTEIRLITKLNCSIDQRNEIRNEILAEIKKIVG